MYHLWKHVGDLAGKYQPFIQVVKEGVVGIGPRESDTHQKVALGPALLRALRVEEPDSDCLNSDISALLESQRYEWSHLLGTFWQNSQNAFCSVRDCSFSGQSLSPNKATQL